MTVPEHVDDHGVGLPVDPTMIFDLSRDLLATVRADRTLIAVSASWARLLGRDIDDYVGHDALEFVHPDDVERTRQAFADLAAGGEGRERFVNRQVHADGSSRWLEWSVTPVSGDTAFGVGRDVTDLRRRENRQQLLNEAWVEISTCDDLDELVSAIAVQARRLTGGHVAVAALLPCPLTPTARTAVAFDGDAAACTIPGDEAPSVYSDLLHLTDVALLPADAPLARDVWAALDLSGDAGHTGALLAAPLVRGNGHTLGVVLVGEPVASHRLTAAEAHIARDFGRLVALTVERMQADARVRDLLHERERLLDGISDAFFTFDDELRFTYLNPAAVALMRRDDLLGRAVPDEYPQFAGSVWEKAFLRSKETGEPVTVTEKNDVMGRTIEARLHPTPDGTVVYVQDVTERMHVETELRLRVEQQALVAELGSAALSGTPLEQLFAAAARGVTEVLRVAHAGVMSLSDDRTAFVVRTGISWDPVNGARDGLPGGGEPLRFPLATLADAAPLRAITHFEPATKEHPPDSSGPHAEYGIRSDVSVPIGRPGSAWGVLTAADTIPRRFADAETVFLQQIAHVLTTAIERAGVEASVKHQATHDHLTGLPNRVLLRDRIEQALDDERTTDGTALILLDLDGFKDVNDSLGHAIGDALLRRVALRLQTGVPGSATVARLGGDEFAVLLPGPVTADDAVRVAERLHAAVGEPFLLPHFGAPLAASFGIVLTPHHGMDASTLLRHADVAMYRAKETNTGIALYDETVDAARAERLTVITDLRAAITSGDLQVHYQPVVDIQSGELVSLEALARWPHPTRGFVPPGEFIPVAEHSGLITPLTLWVLDAVIRQGLAWREQGFTPRIAVNLSVVALRREADARAIVDTVAAAGDMVSIEITESSLVEERARRVLTHLSELGVPCSIDDFGTGYSSLSYLKALPVSTLKIDRLFVRDLDHSDRDLPIVRSVVDLAHAMSLDVIAEGVESADAARRLQWCGVRQAQGWLFAKAMPADELDAWRAARAG